jgi:Tol biopolymer transport system component/DNA-binding winged helix-turn-helix (wHTH) protein
MLKPVQHPQTLQMLEFAEFKVDLRTRELRRNSDRVHLQDQPFSVLALLLEHAGDVVTRQQLRQHLWSSDTFVDFDNSLNTAINKIREALADSAEDPRFLETLPRRGYRFIAPILPTHGAEGHGARPNLPLDLVKVETATHSRKLWRILTPTAVLVVALGGVFAWFSQPLPPPRILSTTQITHDGLLKGQILTDGVRLYITEQKGPNESILIQASTAGGETSIIPTPFSNILVFDISPDRLQLVVANAKPYEEDTLDEEPLWVLPLPTGSPRRLSNIVGHSAAWSADGRRLAFAKGSDIFLAKPDGTDAQKLVTASGIPTGMRFSPDGGRLRFTLNILNNPQRPSRSLWEVRTDGTDLHPLFPAWHYPYFHGVWSEDGRYYFFMRDDPSGGNVWVLREQTRLYRTRPSETFQLTTGPMSLASFTASPDGKKLFAEGYLLHGELFVYDSKERQFLPFLSGIFAGEVDFSRDGKWVAYVTLPERTLWRSRVDGSERLQLTFSPVNAFLPRWSPDGKLIAYTDIANGIANGKTFLISVQGGTPEEMLAEKEVQLDAHWSPDGKKIVFGRGPLSKKIIIQDLDLESRRVSSIKGSEGLYSPRWSPDGQHLAALTSDNKKLLLFDLKTQEWTDWINEAGTVAYPTWSSDGRYIYYKNVSERPSYRRVKLGETHSQLVVDLKDLNLLDHDWAGLTPDGSPIFTRDMGTDEFYRFDVELP